MVLKDPYALYKLQINFYSYIRLEDFDPNTPLPFPNEGKTERQSWIPWSTSLRFSFLFKNRMLELWILEENFALNIEFIPPTVEMLPYMGLKSGSCLNYVQTQYITV